MVATSLLATNAQAWNYYGVALQGAGHPDDAAVAYQTALKLDRDLVEAHFNLGLLCLDVGRNDVAKAEFTSGEANPRFVVTSLKRTECKPKYLYEKLYCARGEMENRIKECQLDLFADRTSAATMAANQLRLWFASLAYVLMCGLRRIGLAHTQFATATCGTIRLKLLKIGALIRISVRRVVIAMASACPCQHEFALAHALLRRAGA